MSQSEQDAQIVELVRQNQTLKIECATLEHSLRAMGNSCAQIGSLVANGDYKRALTLVASSGPGLVRPEDLQARIAELNERSAKLTECQKELQLLGINPI